MTLFAQADAPEALASAEVIAYVLADLAIILLAARIVGGIFVRFKQPRVVGEIIAGVLIGPTVLGGQLAKGAVTATNQAAQDGTGLVNDLYPLQAFSFLNLLGVLTLVFFMFLVGLEVQQRFLRGREAQIAVVSAAVVAVPVALGFLIGGILDDPGKWKVAETAEGGAVSSATHGLFLGAALAVTAFPVMARILQEKRMLATDMGAVGIGAAAVVTPLMFLVLAGATASAKGQGVSDTIGIKFLWAAGLVLLLFFVVRPLLKLVIDWRFQPDKPLDLDLLALLLFGALAAGLAADRIGIHALNGGFLFGAAVPQVEGLGKAIIDRIQTLVIVFLIPVFLAVSGLQTDLTVLKAEHIGGILLFLAAMIVGKWGVGALSGRAVGLNWNQANTIGVLMNCRGLMILVVGLVGLSAGVITPAMQGVFVIGAIVTTLMTGPLVDAFLPDEEVESERQKTVAGSLTGIPAMTGGPRVLVVPAEPGLTAATVAAAQRYSGGDGPAPQFLVAALTSLSENGDYVGAVAADRERTVKQVLGWLEPTAERLAAGGGNAHAVAFESPDPQADLATLATEWAATEAIVARNEDAEALEAAGVTVQRV
jgi:Kef-type K+ transport system membrane component KefB